MSPTPCATVRGYRILVLAVLGSAALAPAAAFDDHDFCVTARQMASAAEGDVGTWLDRSTRNAGVYVSCETRAVEFRRFTYEPASSMDAAWKSRTGQTWSGAKARTDTLPSNMAKNARRKPRSPAIQFAVFSIAARGPESLTVPARERGELTLRSQLAPPRLRAARGCEAA